MKSTFIKNTIKILGRKGKYYASIFLLSSLVIVFVEYAITFALIIFLFSIGFVRQEDIPTLLPKAIVSQPPFVLWLMFLGVGLLRAASKLINGQMGAMILGYVQRRFMIIQGYEMLFAKRPKALPLSTVNLRNSELIPKGASFISNLLLSIGSFINASLLFAGMLYFAPSVTVVSIICLSFLGFIVTKIGRKIIAISDKIPRQQKTIENSIVRIIKNWLLIRIVHIEKAEYEKYKTSVVSYNRLSDRSFFFNNLAAVLPPFWGIFIIAVVIFLDFQIFHTPGVQLVSFLYLFMRFIQVISDGARHSGFLAMYYPPYKILLKMADSLSETGLSIALEDQEPAFSSLKYQSPSDRKYIPGPPSIRIVDCCYTWPDRTIPTITNLSISVPAGDQLGITGPNGSGKSTLLALILGIIKPNKGKLFINEMDVNKYIETYFEKIAYVSSDHYLIEGSVMENLLYGSDHPIKAARAWDVLAQVGLDTMVRELPGKLDYKLQENGAGLSSGQKQRIAIARAMLREPNLLVLDEASSNIDAASEKCLIDFLQFVKGWCTVVIVSHKKEILKNADYLVELSRFTHKSG